MFGSLITTFRSFLRRWPEIPASFKLGIVSLVLGLGFVSLGLSQLYVSANAPVSRDTDLADDQKISVGWLMVDVGGAVVLPGVYQLQTGDRLATAISLAGGILPQADPVFVSQKLNLAEPAKDGQKIYIPYFDEIASDVETSNVSSISTSPPSSSNLISINSASAKELDDLPGIGTARVEAIISHRPYASLEELVSQKIISQTILDEIKGLIKL